MQVHLEDAWRSPLNKVYGLNGKYDRVFQGVLARLDAELGRIDPGAARRLRGRRDGLADGRRRRCSSAPTPPTSTARRRRPARSTGGCWAAASPRRRPPGGASPTCGSWRAQAALELDVEEAQAVLAVAALVGAQPVGMPEPLVRELEALAARIELALESGTAGARRPAARAASGTRSTSCASRPRCGEDMPVRQLLVCRDCRFEKIVNADYQRLAERNRKLGLLMGGVGATIGPGGVNPFVHLRPALPPQEARPRVRLPALPGHAGRPLRRDVLPEVRRAPPGGCAARLPLRVRLPRPGRRLLAQRIRAAKEAAAARAAPPRRPPPEPRRRRASPRRPPRRRRGSRPGRRGAGRRPGRGRSCGDPAAVVADAGARSSRRPARRRARHGRRRARDRPRGGRRHPRRPPRLAPAPAPDAAPRRRAAGGPRVVQRHSVNGTRVGGPLLLRGGETVRLGQTVARVVVATRSGQTEIAELPTA